MPFARKVLNPTDYGYSKHISSKHISSKPISSSGKSSNYFHDIISWNDAKKKIGYEHRFRQFYEWCRDEKSLDFNYYDDSSEIPGKYVIEFKDKKWTIKKKSYGSWTDGRPSM